MLERFRVGFVDQSLGYRVPTKDERVGREMRSRLRQLGVFANSGHEHFRGAVVFPICDAHGRVVEIYGRRTSASQRGSAMHLYLPRPHRGVLNLGALKASREVILCESVIDALTFWRSGFVHVTFGTNGLTDEIVQAFSEHGTERVLIAYDRDEAGDKAAKRAAERLCGLGIDCYRIQFPQGMDANEVAVEAGDEAAKKIGQAIAQAALLGRGQQRPWPDALPSPAQATTAAWDEANVTDGGTSERRPVFAASKPSVDGTSVAQAYPPAPVPPPSADLRAEVHDEEVVLQSGDRRFRVRGLQKNLSFEQLKVNVLVSRGDRFHVDTFDIYSARHRHSFVKLAAAELDMKPETLKTDLSRVLLKLEELQESFIKQALTPKTPKVQLSPEQKEEALELLRDPHLLDRILADFEACGVVGEQSNKLVAYLAAVSRKLDRPLAVVLQSSSAAGKSSLMEAVLSLMPEEERVKFSAMTGQSLFYMGETDLKHKILAVVEEEGAERAAYALKLLQSEGELCIASTGKDPQTGRLVTHEYRVEGPVMIMLTTTAVEIDEELVNRCLVLSVNEERQQTQAIHREQRRSRTLQGLVSRKQRSKVLALHQNAQRLLRPLWVSNPYAEQLTFADHRTRSRRDQMKYLSLIEAIALLHQHQREVKTVTYDGEPIEYIDVTVDDIAVANRLATELMGRSLDELPPQTRRFLGLLYDMVQQACKEAELNQEHFRFTRRQVRAQTGWSYEQVRVHLGRLVDLEYVLAHRGCRGQSFVYELCYDGQGTDGAPHLPGLIDVDALRPSTTKSLGGAEGKFGGGYRPHTGPIPGGSRTPKNVEAAQYSEPFVAADTVVREKALLGPEKTPTPIVPGGHLPREPRTLQAVS
jgi:DNA primase